MIIMFIKFIITNNSGQGAFAPYHIATNKTSAAAQWLNRTYGPQGTYADVASDFKAENSDPNIFAQLVNDSGARFQLDQ